ncbi:hypothetical protein YC2023_098262 [Brassica napus]|uniref:Uncharacterized protein n=1 Tax=Brassica oleracea var. oleracea TaxID=109376 RepID=A0A0D3DJR6_BRAOL
MTSWKKTIATPFKKAATFFNQPQQTSHNRHANAKAREEHERRTVKELQGDVMACGYEDVLVMWSILDKSNSSNNLSTSLRTNTCFRLQDTNNRRDIYTYIYTSRYAPRDDHRENNRQAPRDRDILPPSKEAYNKRRYDDSFAASKHREEARRAERKHVPTSHSSKGERASKGPSDKQPARPSSSSKGETAAEDPPKTLLEQCQLAKQTNFSPDHVRERPFRLSLQKKSSGELKLKGKVGDLGDSSESVSSAKKSLKFAVEANRSPPKSQPQLPRVNSEKRKKKSEISND